jgi:hypothetical protein
LNWEVKLKNPKLKKYFLFLPRTVFVLRNFFKIFGSSWFQPVPAGSSRFQPVPAGSSRFQPVPAVAPAYFT